MTRSDLNQPFSTKDIPGGRSQSGVSGESTENRTLSSFLSTRSRARSWIVRGIILANAVLLCGTLLVGWLVRQSMRELTGKSMDSGLAANVASLELWLQQRRDDVRRQAQDDSFYPAAQGLLKQYGSEAELDAAVLSSRQGELSFANWEKLTASGRYLGWVLLDNQSRVIAGSHEPLVGESFLLPSDISPRLTQLQTTVTRPFKSRMPLTLSGRLANADAPTMVAVAPICEGCLLYTSDAADE